MVRAGVALLLLAPVLAVAGRGLGPVGPLRALVPLSVVGLGSSLLLTALHVRHLKHRWLAAGGLAGLDDREVRSQTEADRGRLRAVVTDLASLEEQLAGLQEGIRERRRGEGRAYLTPEEDDELRWRFVSYLSLRTALLRLVTTYSGSEVVREPPGRVAGGSHLA